MNRLIKDLKRNVKRKIRYRKNKFINKYFIPLAVGLFVIGGCSFVTDKNSFNSLFDNSEQFTVANYDIRCIDGDTFELTDNETNIKEKIRLLAVDSPEYTTTKEPYGKQASDFTCNALKESESIKLKTDRGNEIDKYDRNLYWVYLDNQLLQEQLVLNGLAEIKYVDNKTVNEIELAKLEVAEIQAKTKRMNMWGE